MSRKPWSAPRHLRPPTRRWLQEIARLWVLGPHHVRLLVLLGEVADRYEQARETLAAKGVVQADRFGFERPRPEVAVERDSRLAIARLLRELGLDAETRPEAPRPPALPGGRD